MQTARTMQLISTIFSDGHFLHNLHIQQKIFTWTAILKILGPGSGQCKTYG